MNKVLVTGASGVVGGYVRDVFSDYELVLTDIVGDDVEQMDVGDPVAVRKVVGAAQPDAIVHLAAATDVDVCEQDHDLAFLTNAIGTQNVALAAREVGAIVVYTSTAGVFGGDKPEPYTEFDVPAPANVYGHSKLAGERVVETLLDRFYIARAGWMVGGGPKDKKFVGKLLQIMDGGEKHLRAVGDKFGTPTYAKDLAGGLRHLLESGQFGLYHMVNRGGSCSRYDVAVALCEIAGFHDVTVEAVSSARFPLPAPRARSEAMLNYKLELLGTNPMRHWRDALEAYVTEELRLASGPAGAAPVPDR
ncbi:MAG: dTDP-4-dehydrorhamnose reductase [Gaiellaceae bacterium]|nr:dTDP-4-dehydrorhamnose reductase [Gaiellaceae bacterium]